MRLSSAGRFLSGVAFSIAFVASSVLLGAGASASPQWCEEDPTFVVNGALVDVSTTFAYEYAGSVKGPVEFELLVPSNVVAAVVSLPGTVPVTAKITRSLPATGLLFIPVVVKVTVPATASFATSTRITGTYLWLSSKAAGKSNTTTKVSVTLIGL